ncbi:MAG TPA: tetratricopeptide repeat protein [Candidatus Polarisedimenticolia bacterium]|nr:tetratricopeptide repeat protein [Candidatus Polarisedimenticolia bacterium]
MPNPQDDRLDSWKEIAAYLRRDESTVRRWQKDGLPVHRHHHKFRAAVFAYKSELDAWWNAAERETVETPIEGAGPPGDLTASPADPIASGAAGPPRPGPAEHEGGVASRFPARLAALLVAVIAGGAVAWWAWQQYARAAVVPRNLVLAVLPLQNLSGDPNEEYFSDGLTEELITQLSRLQPDHLAVIARTSTMQYKGTAKRVDAIGRELGADFLLEGSVRRAGGQVRVSAQLIRISDQTHVWAESYQREAHDVLALQSDVAAAVAGAVSLRLTPRQRADLASARPVVPASYQLYLRGRYLWNQRTEDGLQKSIASFQQALVEDPTHAAAYSALADAYNVLGNWGMVPPKDAYPNAKAAASKALGLDARLAEAHIALAYAIHLYDWNPTAAETEFRRGLELNPNYAPGHQWYAVFLASEGRFEEAVAQITRARELDPLSLIIGDVVGWIDALARRNDDAVREFRKAIELDPRFYPTHYDLGLTYVEMGRYEEAIAELEQARSLAGDTPRTLSGLAYAYAMAQQRDRARTVLDQLRTLSTRRYVPPFDIAVVHAALGERDLAFAWLDRAYEDRHPWLVMLKVTPKVDRLRSDPRFAALLERIAASSIPVASATQP